MLVDPSLITSLQKGIWPCLKPNMSLLQLRAESLCYAGLGSFAEPLKGSFTQVNNLCSKGEALEHISTVLAFHPLQWGRCQCQWTRGQSQYHSVSKLWSTLNSSLRCFPPSLTFKDNGKALFTHILELIGEHSKNIPREINYLTSIIAREQDTVLHKGILIGPALWPNT